MSKGDILISVQRKFVERILAGKKAAELRRRAPLQLQLKQAMRQGFNYQLSYTWSKSMDDTGGSRSAYGVNGAPSSYAEYGLSGTDIPHHVAFYAIYNIPFGQGGRSVVHELIRNWSVSGIFRYLSGTPLTVTTTGCSSLTYAGTCYPNLNPNFAGNPRINRGWGRQNLASGTSVPYIDAKAFVAAPNYTLGNASRSYVYKMRGPGNYEEDMSLRRTFGIFENLKFTFEASLFNLDNHTDFGNPNTVFGSAAFGQISNQANTPRDAQFSGRSEF